MVSSEIVRGRVDFADRGGGNFEAWLVDDSTGRRIEPEETRRLFAELRITGVHVKQQPYGGSWSGSIPHLGAIDEITETHVVVDGFPIEREVFQQRFRLD